MYGDYIIFWLYSIHFCCVWLCWALVVRYRPQFRLTRSPHVCVLLVWSLYAHVWPSMYTYLITMYTCMIGICTCMIGYTHMYDRLLYMYDPSSYFEYKMWVSGVARCCGVAQCSPATTYSGVDSQLTYSVYESTVLGHRTSVRIVYPSHYLLSWSCVIDLVCDVCRLKWSYTVCVDWRHVCDTSDIAHILLPW